MKIKERLKKKCSTNILDDSISLKLFAYIVIDSVIYIAVTAKCSIECILLLYIYIHSFIWFLSLIRYPNHITMLAIVDEVLSIKYIHSILFFIWYYVCSES